MDDFIVKTAAFVKSAVSPRDLIRDGLPQVAFAGRSNVGKSSLLNTLANRRGLARTSGTPGRTREVNYFLINGAFYFVDLPGYGYAKVSRSVSVAWKPLIEAYIRDNPALRVMIVILDARRVPGAEDLQLIEWLEAANVAYLPILTKRDKLTLNQFREQERKIRAALGFPDEVELAVFSAKTRLGREPLLNMIGELTAQ